MVLAADEHTRQMLGYASTSAYQGMDGSNMLAELCHYQSVKLTVPKATEACTLHGVRAALPPAAQRLKNGFSNEN